MGFIIFSGGPGDQFGIVGLFNPNGVICDNWGCDDKLQWADGTWYDREVTDRVQANEGTPANAVAEHLYLFFDVSNVNLYLPTYCQFACPLH